MIGQPIAVQIVLRRPVVGAVVFSVPVPSFFVSIVIGGPGHGARFCACRFRSGQRFLFWYLFWFLDVLVEGGVGVYKQTPLYLRRLALFVLEGSVVAR